MPESYPEFKTLVSAAFPRIYDTKQITFKVKPLLENAGLDDIAG